MAISALAGLSLPALKGAGGRFASRSPYDMAWSDLVITLLTATGGRAMNRGFGSGIPSIPFEPNDPTTANLLTMVAQQALAQWCPHIRLLGIKVQTKTDSTLQAQITFTLASDPKNPVTKGIALDRTQTMQILAARSVTP